MAYVLIEGYMCERCGYRWGSRTGTGTRTEKDPKVCPKCKTLYWNRPRTIKIAQERQATPWNLQHSPSSDRAKQDSTDTVRGGRRKPRSNYYQAKSSSRPTNDLTDEMQGGEHGTHEEEKLGQHQVAGRQDSGSDLRQNQDVENSVDAQVKECRAWAERNGHVVIREFIDRARSGRASDRPDFQEMMEAAGDPRSLAGKSLAGFRTT